MQLQESIFIFKNKASPSRCLNQPHFTLSDLSINPLEAFVGEAVQISVNLTNIGDVEGNQTVNLEINNVC